MLKEDIKQMKEHNYNKFLLIFFFFFHLIINW